MTKPFAPLPLEQWRSTRDTLAGYARFVRRIRQYNTPRQKHWWHTSLHLTATGLTTTPMRDENGLFFALDLDLAQHRLAITRGDGLTRTVALRGQSVRAFKEATLDGLGALAIHAQYDHEEFNDNAPGAYDRDAVAAYWVTLSEVYTVLRAFRHTFNEETSPVQLWAHHFDLAVVWFSGRKVPDQNPDEPEYADEQMNFGFSTGDSGVPEPYFYATAYPAPANWMTGPLIECARWHNDGWSGALLPYERLVGVENGRQLLADFLQAAYHAGAERMRDGETAPAAGAG